MSWKLLIASITIHLILIYSIFDVYYTSPVVHGIRAHSQSNSEPPAKRIFLISADGLRYDTFNNHPEMSPYLHSIIRNRKGISGLSLSHVPTESRPGHVAIFAGITEDMSAVAKGWKKNPVKFDSVFNRSRNCWMWGSPDIVNLFDDLPNAQSFFYSEEEEDFSTNDAANLDKWVFDNFEKFLLNSTGDSKIHESRNIFFLHLLGIDTNGHGNKPASFQYIENIRVVDSGIERVQKLVDDFFGDDKTAWIFTSDHGMTDWGSHGAGSNEEVLTPFVAWGAGIRKGGARHSLNQIDLTPLISALIGSAIPINSMGVLPVHTMDSGNSKYEFRSVLSNFYQLREQIKFLRDAKSHRPWFRQFPEFGNKAMDSLENEMIRLAKARRFEGATSLFSAKAHLLKSAIVYYHRYDRQMLGAAVSCTFVSWISLIAAFLMRESLPKSGDFYPKKAFWIAGGIAIAFAFYCPLSFTEIIYLVMPIYLLAVLENYADVSSNVLIFIRELISKKYQFSSMDRFAKLFIGFIGFSITICIFVLTFLDRRFLAAVFLLLGFLPSAYDSNVVLAWTRTWRVLSISLTIFPFLPPVGVSTYLPICVASPFILHIFCRKYIKIARISQHIRLLSIILLATSIFIGVINVVFTKPPTIARWIAWMSIPLSFLAPLATIDGGYVVDRLIIYPIAFFIPYSLLSIAYESLFVLLFLPLVTLFFRFEFGHLSDAELLASTVDSMRFSSSVLAEIRCGVVCVAFVLCTLFGTGNFASINSFNPSTLNLFISVFSPFTMAVLLILKLVIPILCVSMIFVAVVRFHTKTIQRLCCVVLIITDFMSMCFFHQLRDEGSWLDIGMSISQYIVSMCISLAMLILLSISRFIMLWQKSTPFDLHAKWIDDLSVEMKTKESDASHNA